MKLSTTKFMLLLAFAVCLMASKVAANHKWEKDCEDDENEEDEDDNDWDDDNNDWDDHDDHGDWNSGNPKSGSVIIVSSTIWSATVWPMPTNSQPKSSKHQYSSSESQPSVDHTSDSAQPSVYYPSGLTSTSSTSQIQTSLYNPSVSGAVTATWTQVVTTTGKPTDGKSEPQIGSMSSPKKIGGPIMLAAILFAIIILA